MRLRWTVVDASGVHPRSRDVVVRCPSGTPFGALVDHLVGAEPGWSGTDEPGRAAEVAGRALARGDVVGMPPLLDGAVVTLRPPLPPAVPPAPGHLVELVVTSGPDAGTVVPLRRGTTTVGRSAGNDVRLRDPRLSRRHCSLVVGPDGVRLVLSSGTDTTGSGAGRGAEGGASHAPVCGGRSARADVARHRVRSGSGGRRPEQVAPRVLGLDLPWEAGANRLVLRAATRSPELVLTTTDTGEGTREVRPAPRTRSPEAARQVALPPPSREGRSGAFPFLAVVLPALAAGGLAWWTGSAVYLALAALGPLLVVGSWWTARRDARREGTLGRRAHARACEALRSEAADAATVLARARARAMPDAVTLLDACTGVEGPLWARHHLDGDAVRVRLGRAAGPGPPGGRDLAGRVTTVDHDGRVEVVATADDLLAVDLREGHLGLVDPTEDHGSARFVVGQLVALLPPTSLTVVPVVGPDASVAWRWLSVLPHVQGPGGGEPDAARTALQGVLELTAARRQARSTGTADGGGQPEPAVLVVLAGVDRLVDASDVERLAGAHLLGVHVLVVAEAAGRLPRVCGAVLTADSPDGVEARLTMTADGASGRVVLDTVAPWWSRRLARALAPLRPAADTVGALPARVRLEDLLATDPAAVRERWARSDGGLPVPLGVGPSGPVTVDLTTAGPHALVAGTTGSGKSELLRSWLLALAASQPPDRLSMLLVDYKGGATFDDLAALPHCVGLLTDLDGGTTGRVLHSLRAEVRRRERLLVAAGARDLAAYRALPAASSRPLPRLLVVVDEFRVLAEDAPDVLGQFVRLAATGRSLGVHLVLATQRPGGVVSADIRANTGLRIALRVQDVAESRDVVERPDAAWLPASAPGRAVLVGAGVDVVLQTAWTGGQADGPEVSVELDAGEQAPRAVGPPARSSAVPGRVSVGRRGPGRRRAHGAGGEGRAAGAAGVVATVVQAARLAGTPRALPPWLPPLPHRVERLGDGTGEPPGVRTRAGEGSLDIGVADVPWAQARVPLRWSPLTDGPLLVLGASRSGRSSTVRTVGDAAARAGIPVVHLTGPGGEDHVGDVLATLLVPPPPVPTGPDGRAGPTGLPALDRTLTTAPGPSAPGAAPRVLLLMDDVDELLDPGADPAPAELLGRLLRSGHRDGVGIVLAGGRALAASRAAAGTRARLVHSTVDRADALLAGVPPGAAPLPPVAGRCHVLGVDVGPCAVGADADADWSGQAGGGPQVVEAQVFAPVPPTRAGVVTGRPSWVPAPLPVHLDATELPPPDRAALALGRTGDGGTWTLDPLVGGVVAVTGPARSGRTTTLRLVAAQALAAGVPVRVGLSTVARARSWTDGGLPSPRDPTAPTTGTDSSTGRARLLLVDDLDRSTDADLSTLERWLEGGSGPLSEVLHPGATVVVAGRTTWFADAFRGVPALVRQTGRGVVLHPGRTDVRDVLGVRGGPSQSDRHPGRGLLVADGRVARVQVAVARPPASGRTSLPGPLPSGVTPTGGPTA